MQNEKDKTRSKKHHGRASVLLLAIPGAVILAAVAYLVVRTLLFLIADYVWYEKVVALVLLLAEGFLLLHGVGYFMEIVRVLARRRGWRISETEIPALESFPPVAVIVSSFKEPIPVIRDTLTAFYNLDYPNKQIYLLDDTRYDMPGSDVQEMTDYRNAVGNLCRDLKVDLFRRSWRGAKAGMINDFLEFVDGKAKEGFSIQRFAHSLPTDKPKYIVVFDADMNPFPSFLGKLVPIMESQPQMAFIQTPQYYTNFEANRIARAAGLQQAVFYEYICEGKSLQDAMFCCGTNVIFRREALMDVGGFDETSVTEDFATSLKFHLRGWHSAYLNRVGAFGMGPEDLVSYFKQQFRWALGTIGLFRKIIILFLRNPKSLTKARWWEYVLSGSYYFVGFVFFVLAVCPILYLFFNVPTFFARPEIYVLFFVPYFVLTLSIYAFTLRARHYTFKELVTGQLLIAISFPVYLRAALLALLGIRGKFAVTGKDGSAIVPWQAIWAQLALAGACVAAIAWGANRLYYERAGVPAIAVNMVWCLYHTLILSAVLYFRNPAETKKEAQA
ncbi:MAG: glycosyltransferase family 2 protein [Kiritimatiellia bacterium]